ncbi:diacylglycerol kinase family protein [Streptomyces sp. NPDC051976]|uniref:diacylglycerol/lipid kinase family protein n=1 Tax=Streptomyces sp. NPDC051976 TaxID=3154947 RepID=UPI00341A38BC
MTTIARARLLARVALLCAVAAIAVLLAFAGTRTALVVLAGLAGLALAAAGIWWALARRGLIRVLGSLLALAAPAAVLVLYASTNLLLTATASVALWAVAAGCAQLALRVDRPRHRMPAVRGEPPRRPVLIMNPRSGGGKVEKFGLADKARALGAQVVLLDTTTHQDVAALARQALAEGADLLGVAGGDGTQALVAAVAAEHDIPFLVISAGTRNHFAMDLGLDRNDPAACLDALTDGEELKVDLGTVAGRAFVNTVSFGTYAEIVQSPAYRDAKATTALDALPDLLDTRSGKGLRVEIDGARPETPQALLVSNNPYGAAEPVTAGRRPRLDTGTLGVLGLRVTSAAQAADLALRGQRATGISVTTAHTLVVSAAEPTIPVAVDGEALTLPVPVHCAIRPGALRVRVPRHRPGVPAAAHPLRWRRVRQLAFGHGEEDSREQ